VLPLSGGIILSDMRIRPRTPGPGFFLFGDSANHVMDYPLADWLTGPLRKEAGAFFVK
jgi:hypothetical protein